MPALAIVFVQSPSCVLLFETPWTAARQASLSLTISWSLPKFMSTASAMPSNHLILYCPLLLLPSVFPSIRFFSNELAVHIRWTNLDSVLKSRHITLPMNTYIVKAIVVFMYRFMCRCESWTIKKAEQQRIDAFKLLCWRRLLRVP